MATYVGVDVGKKSLNIYLTIINKNIEISNNEDGFSKLLTNLMKHYQDLSELIVVFEPTGGYEQKLREFLKSQNIHYSTVHPNKVRNYAKARGWLAKTDNIDSKLLYEYANNFQLPVKKDYNTESQQILHDLLKRREQIILFRTQEITRMDTAYNPIILHSLNQHIDNLTTQLKEIENNIKNLVTQDEIIKNKVEQLTSIPAVGITLATTVICEAPELGHIEFNKLTSLIGLAPFAKESGGYKGKRRIFAGRGNLRKVLYMAAVASLRCNKRLRSFYDRLIANHKPPKLALTAVMRKLLAFMHSIIKHNSFWSENLC